MSKKKNAKNAAKERGSLPERENVAYRDYRGKEREKDNKRDDPLAPDGISGYW